MPLRDSVERAASARWLAAAGVVAAAVLATSVNVLVARFYHRWDWTTERIYTLTDATKQTLRSLGEPVEVVVFLAQSDPLTLTVRHMLDAYGSETRQLVTRWVDPDRDPAQFLALQQELGIRVEGKTEDGRLVTDAVVVVSRGAKRWFLTTGDFFAYDDEGRARSRLEQSLTGAIRNVLGSERALLCFATGHGEISMDDGGPNGLAELRYRLEKNNFEPRAVDLSAQTKGEPLGPCRLLVVAGPEEKFSPAEAEPVLRYLRDGGSVLMLVNPLLDADSRIVPSGLEVVAGAAGIELGQDFVVETDAAARLPTGAGETFFAAPALHDITKGLVGDGDQPVRVLLSGAQSLRAAERGPAASTLLTTSERAHAFRDIRPFVNEGRAIDASDADRTGPFAVAMAGELPKRGDAPHGPRVVVVGTASAAWGRNWRDAGLAGVRAFLESAISWLTARPAILDVPEKPAAEAGLRLTEESSAEVVRYVLVYMPGTALLLGILVMYRRRSVERASRRGPREHERR